MTDRVEEGLVLFDEALAATCAGELTGAGHRGLDLLRVLLGV